VCAAGFGGADCAAQSRALVFAASAGDPVATGAASGTLTAAIDANAWAYFHVAIPNATAGLGLRVTVARAAGAAGDPDFYAAVNAFPALDSFVASDATCDSCGGPPATHSLWIAPSQLRTGRVVIGAFAYCCDATSVTVSAAFVAGPDIVPPTPAAGAGAENSSLWARGMNLVFSVTGLVVACVIVAVLMGIVAVRWYRQRELQRAAQDSQLHAANQVAADGFAFGGDLDGVGGSMGGSDGMSHIELDDRSSLYQPPGVVQSYVPVGAVASSSSSSSLSASSMGHQLGGGSAEPSEFDPDHEPVRAPITPRETYAVLTGHDAEGV
jgi:hypothetical protein